MSARPSSVRRAPRRRRVPSIEVRAAERRIDGVHRDRGTKRCRRARTWAGYPCPAQTSCASIAKAPETNRWLKRPRVTCAGTNASISRPCSMKVRRARRALHLETALELCKGGLSRDVIGVPSPVCWWIGLRTRSCSPAGPACRGGCGAKPQPTSGRRRGRACCDDESRLRKPGVLKSWGPRRVRYRSRRRQPTPAALSGRPLDCQLLTNERESRRARFGGARCRSRRVAEARCAPAGQSASKSSFRERRRTCRGAPPVSLGVGRDRSGSGWRKHGVAGWLGDCSARWRVRSTAGWAIASVSRSATSGGLPSSGQWNSPDFAES